MGGQYGPGAKEREEPLADCRSFPGGDAGMEEEIYHAEVLSPALIGRVFAYLTVFEYISVSKVSKSWAKIALEETVPCMTSFDAAQLWYLLGQTDPAPVVAMISRFVHVHRYSFAYCHHLTDSKLLSLLESIPNKANVRFMSLFYCHKVTDQSIRFIARTFPNLEELNLGSLFEITDKSIQAIAQFGRNIRRLYLHHNERFTNDILIDLSTMVNLRFVDLQFTKIEAKFVDEHRESFPHVVMLGPDRFQGDLTRMHRGGGGGGGGARLPV